MRTVSIPALAGLLIPTLAVPASAASGPSSSGAIVPVAGLVVVAAMALLIRRAHAEREKRVPVRIRSSR